MHPSETAPNVRFEPCAAYSGDDVSGCCAVCGWLEQDHELVSARVVRLPVRRRVERRAS
ncbi:MAG TPA: hypothetical protein VIB48_09800 [Acidimicrobiia bacterium]|jgi:hypothetical protein